MSLCATGSHGHCGFDRDAQDAKFTAGVRQKLSVSPEKYKTVAFVCDFFIILLFFTYKWKTSYHLFQYSKLKKVNQFIRKLIWIKYYCLQFDTLFIILHFFFLFFASFVYFILPVLAALGGFRPFCFLFLILI